MARHAWILALAGVLLLGGFLVAPKPAPADGKTEEAAPADTKPPVPVQTVQPEYPKAARAEKAEGMVVVKLLVGADGTPKKAGIQESSGRQDFDKAALLALGQWRFQPATRDGEAVEMEIAVPIRFALDGDGASDGDAKVKTKKKMKTKSKS